MKRIPFKCQEGHVTIKSFRSSEETPSEISCEEEIKNLVMVSDGGSRPWMAIYIERPMVEDGRKAKIAANICNKRR